MIKILRSILGVLVTSAFFFIGYVIYFATLSSGYHFVTDGTILIRRGTGVVEALIELTTKNIAKPGMVADIIVTHLTKHFGALKFGEYKFKDHISLYSAVLSIIHGKVYYRKILVRGGESFENVVASLNEAYGLSGNDVSMKLLVKSGCLAETYYYTYGERKEDVMKRMVYSLQSFAYNEFQKRSGLCSLGSVHDVITLSAIVEKETVGDESKIIASVYLNRLAKKMRLQADPCIMFITKRKNINWSDLFIESPYNTYRNKGLPPGPICAVSREAVMAVLHPTKTDYLFFVSNNMGGHWFSKTFNEHKIKRAKYKKGS